jgi:hypothetical protein
MCGYSYGMSEGFAVDVEALRKAAEGVVDTLNHMATKKVSDIDAPKEAFGYEALGDAVEEFCDRWQLGVDNLTKDAAQYVYRLAWSVHEYQRIEATVHQSFDGILRQLDGKDPGAVAE